jgi:hypothetical protein
VTVTMTTPGITGDAGGMSTPPDPGVPAKARRRRFSAEYKLAILREADACTQSGEVGALLRREGCTPRIWSTGAASVTRARCRRWRVGGAVRRPTRPPRSWRGCGVTTSAWRPSWRRRSGSSRSRETSPSCWGSRSTRRATTTRARADGHDQHCRSRAWRRAGVSDARAVTGDLVSAPSTSGAQGPPTATPGPRALSDAERQQLGEVLCSPRFVDVPGRDRRDAAGRGRLAGLGTHDVPVVGRARPDRRAAQPARPRAPPAARAARDPPISCGVGTSPSCSARRPGPTTTCR